MCMWPYYLIICSNILLYVKFIYVLSSDWVFFVSVDSHLQRVAEDGSPKAKLLEAVCCGYNLWPMYVHRILCPDTAKWWEHSLLIRFEKAQEEV